jgi:hexosaminidase
MTAARYPLIPWPLSLEPRSGTLVLRHGAPVALADGVPSWVAAPITSGARAALRLVSGSSAGPAVTFELRADRRAGPESYTVDVAEPAARVEAPSARGLFYGAQTLRQLMAVEGGNGVRIPAVRIDDAPRFAYRGLHLDVGRHFFPVAFIERYIDLMALFKLNTFHWHLTEDQGWRLEIARYPRLVEVGSRRRETLVGHARRGPRSYDGTPHGGFYTQGEARAVVAYARERAIEVLPEIEMPGHSLAALAAYPELACRPGPFEVATSWGVFEDILCPREATLDFVENVLREVMAIFPGSYVHIGGDEAPKARWRECAEAQAIIRREGLADENELQSWFIRRVERFLQASGRRLVGWDEILEGGLAPHATVMSWRDTTGGIAAAKAGHDVIMSPQEDLYFDHYQGDPATEPLAIGGLTTLEEVYAYEPIPPELTGEETRRVLGAQGNVWTEYMATPEQVEYMAYPRAVALAEVLWSPKATRAWGSFRMRLAAALATLDRLGVNYRHPPP